MGNILKPLVPCVCRSPPGQVTAVAPLAEQEHRGRYWPCPGISRLKERTSHHLPHRRLIVHHEHNPGMRENLAVSHVAAPGIGELLLSVFPLPSLVR